MGSNIILNITYVKPVIHDIVVKLGNIKNEQNK